MSKTRVTQDQFELLGRSLVHRPTGAHFSIYPDASSLGMVNWASAGERLRTGEDYDRDEIGQVASQLLAEMKPGDNQKE